MSDSIQNGIQGYNSGARFGLNPIPRHIHNGSDSPFVFQPILTYAGIIDSNGGAALLPTGWGLKHTQTGVYTVTHGLGTQALFSIVATPADQGTPCSINLVTSANGNSIQFDVYSIGSSPSLINNAFYFTLTVVNNRVPSIPLYVGRLAS